MTARTPCHVPGCRRTRKAHPIDTEWLCAKHWALVPRRGRQAYLRAKRQRKPSGTGAPHAAQQCLPYAALRRRNYPEADPPIEAPR